MKLLREVGAAVLLLAASAPVFADEGMWVLKELNKQAEQKGLSGIWLECSSDRYRFMLTSFHYSYYGDEANLILNGYLFMK